MDMKNLCILLPDEGFNLLFGDIPRKIVQHHTGIGQRCWNTKGDDLLIVFVPQMFNQIDNQTAGAPGQEIGNGMNNFGPYVII